MLKERLWGGRSLSWAREYSESVKHSVRERFRQALGMNRTIDEDVYHLKSVRFQKVSPAVCYRSLSIDSKGDPAFLSSVRDAANRRYGTRNKTEGEQALADSLEGEWLYIILCYGDGIQVFLYSEVEAMSELYFDRKASDNEASERMREKNTNEQRLGMSSGNIMGPTIDRNWISREMMTNSLRFSAQRTTDNRLPNPIECNRNDYPGLNAGKSSVKHSDELTELFSLVLRDGARCAVFLANRTVAFVPQSNPYELRIIDPSKSDNYNLKHRIELITPIVSLHLMNSSIKDDSEYFHLLDPPLRHPNDVLTRSKAGQGLVAGDDLEGARDARAEFAEELLEETERPDTDSNSLSSRRNSSSNSVREQSDSFYNGERLIVANHRNLRWLTDQGEATATLAVAPSGKEPALAIGPGSLLWFESARGYLVAVDESVRIVCAESLAHFGADTTVIASWEDCGAFSTDEAHNEASELLMHEPCESQKAVLGAITTLKVARAFSRKNHNSFTSANTYAVNNGYTASNETVLTHTTANESGTGRRTDSECNVCCLVAAVNVIGSIAVMFEYCGEGRLNALYKVDEEANSVPWPLTGNRCDLVTSVAITEDSQMLIASNNGVCKILDETGKLSHFRLGSPIINECFDLQVAMIPSCFGVVQEKPTSGMRSDAFKAVNILAGGSAFGANSRLQKANALNTNSMNNNALNTSGVHHSNRSSAHQYGNGQLAHGLARNTNFSNQRAGCKILMTSLEGYLHEILFEQNFQSVQPVNRAHFFTSPPFAQWAKSLDTAACSFKICRPRHHHREKLYRRSLILWPSVNPRAMALRQTDLSSNERDSSAGIPKCAKDPLPIGTPPDALRGFLPASLPGSLPDSLPDSAPSGLSSSSAKPTVMVLVNHQAPSSGGNQPKDAAALADCEALPMVDSPENEISAFGCAQIKRLKPKAPKLESRQSTPRSYKSEDSNSLVPRGNANSKSEKVSAPLEPQNSEAWPDGDVQFDSKLPSYSGSDLSL